MGFTSGASDMLPSIPLSIADLDIVLDFFKVVLSCLGHATIDTTMHTLLTLILDLNCFSKLSSGVRTSHHQFNHAYIADLHIGLREGVKRN